MTSRPLLIVLGLLLGGCDLLTGAPRSVLVGSGRVDRAEWQISAALLQTGGLYGEQICLEIAVADAAWRGTCTNADRAGPGSGGGWATRDQAYVTVDGIITYGTSSFDTPPPSRIVIDTNTGMQQAAVAPLDGLGLSAVAFGLVLPKGTRLMTMTWFDASGAEIARHDLR